MRILKGLLALLAVIAIVVVVPALLLQSSGGILAGLSSLGDTIRYGLPDFGGRILAGTLLPLIGWVLWASLIWSLALETLALIRQKPVGRIPAIGIQRQLAAVLIGSIITMVGAGTMATTAMAAPSSSPTTAAPTTISASLHAGTTATTTAVEAADDVAAQQKATTAPGVTVKPGDTLWGLAETHLGDGARWGEILTLNLGSPQPDGMSLSADGHIQPGWKLQLPEAPKAVSGHMVTVAEGDTLSSIAATHLGDAERWPEIFAANQGTTQADGGHLADPSLIRTGWQLTIPGTAASPVPPPASAPAPAPVQGAPAVAEAAPAAPVMPSSAEAPTAVPAQPAPETPSASADPSFTTTATPAPSAAADQPAPAATSSASAEAAPSPAPSSAAAEEQAPAEEQNLLATSGGILGVLAAGLLGVLAVKRFRQARGRKRGETIPVPAAEEFVTEQELVAVVGDTDPRQGVDKALRWLASWAAQTERKLPSLFAARLTDASLELYLNETSELPAPFVSIAPDNTAWKVSLEEVPEVIAPHSAPFPALVTLGRDRNGGLLLSDLESIAAMTISGPSELARGAMMAMAVELAVSPWADDLQVTMIGCDQDLPDVMDTGRIRHLDTLEDLIEDLEGRARQLDKLLAAIGAADLAEARSRGTYSDNWIPEVVILAQEPGEETRARLARLIEQVPRVGIASVSSSAIHGPWDLQLTDKDNAVLAPDGIRLVPQLISDEEYRHLIGVMRTADLPPVPVEQVIPAVPDDISTLAPVPGNQEPGPEDDEDPLAAFNKDAPVLDVLGPVKLLNAAGLRPTTASGGGSHLGRSYEILTYLAFHPHVGYEDFHKAMWPGTNPEDGLQTRNSACSRARRLIGKKNPDTEWFPYVLPSVGIYGLHPEVLTTWHHWKALVTDHPEKVSTKRLTQAMKLVRGEPLPAAGRGLGWALVLRGEMTVAIADAATILWERAFGTGDFATAALAADAGIRAEPFNEDLHRKALRVAAVTGDRERAAELMNTFQGRLTKKDEEAAPEPETMELMAAMDLT
ncbi:LysM repeat protein/DNA-binding SARP family transcriptional activator [Arthrobacter sp. GAS37]|uniref:LysM peptidoglycan-binding domain-containing protein n=1 Tax=Arthrobacter sp. GAS37 TaxID=3156261 RepID=UPI0038376318